MNPQKLIIPWNKCHDTFTGLEELYYHTKEDSKYISELKKALIETGIYDENLTMKSKNILDLSQFVLIVVIVALLGSILLFLCIDPDILINGTLNPVLSIFNAILVAFTLLVLFQYAKDTNLMAKETKRMAEIQHESQFYPSIAVEVWSYFELIHNLGFYSVMVRYKNESKYPVTITENKEFYWFNEKFNAIDVIKNKPLEADNIFQIPPNTCIQLDYRIAEKKTQNVLNALHEGCSPTIWVNHIRSPYYLSLKYKADNGFMSSDVTQIPIQYNIRFKFKEEIQLMAEPENKYMNIFGGKTPDKVKEEIIDRVMYANIEASEKKWIIQ